MQSIRNMHIAPLSTQNDLIPDDKKVAFGLLPCLQWGQSILHSRKYTKQKCTEMSPLPLGFLYSKIYSSDQYNAELCYLYLTFKVSLLLNLNFHNTTPKNMKEIQRRTHTSPMTAPIRQYKRVTVHMTGIAMVYQEPI